MSNNSDKRSSTRVNYPGERPPELDDWVPHQTKGFKEKFTEKVKQNPFVPLGCMLTATALTFGLIQFRKGQTKKSQLMMRFRVGAQAFTIGAIIIGVAIQAARGTSNKAPTVPASQK